MIRTLRIIFVISVSLAGCKHDVPRPFVLEKVVFHSKGKGCEGHCNTYHLEVDSSQVVKLFAEDVFKDYGEITRIFKVALEKQDSVYQDSLRVKAKMGYFTGSAKDSTYAKLKSALNKINLDSLEYKNQKGYDGINTTLIVYYNGKRKVLEGMFPPDSARLIYQSLHDIFKQDNYTRTDTFQLEE